MYSSTSPSQYHIEHSAYENQIPRKRGEVAFNPELKCILWQCDIEGCTQTFDNARKWRKHHLKQGPHKGDGVIKYYSSATTHRLTYKQRSRLKGSLIAKIKEERASIQSAIQNSEERIKRLHSSLIF
jgi:hypothetical protein